MHILITQWISLQFSKYLLDSEFSIKLVDCKIFFCKITALGIVNESGIVIILHLTQDSDPSEITTLMYW